MPSQADSDTEGTAMTTNAEKIQAVTDQLVDLVTNGNTDTWKPSWAGTTVGLPINHTTGKQYQGSNQVLLIIIGWATGYTHQRWATYKQWQGVGGQVRKGEKGTRLTKWGVTYKCQTHGKSKSPCCKQADKFMWANTFTVFNISQVDGVDLPESVTIPETDRPALVQDFLTAVGATVREVPMTTNGAPHYNLGTQIIEMPKVGQFDSPEAWAGTLFHELTHWTGHQTRVDRHDGKDLAGATTDRAHEELVAEFGSAILQSALGVPGDDNRHAAYIGSWVKVLNDEDPMNLYRAARDAATAAQFLLDQAEQGGFTLPAQAVTMEEAA